MKLAALAKLIKADAYCKLYNVCYEAGGYDLYIGTRTGIYSLAGFPKAQNSDELAALLDISPNSWKDIQFGDECPESERNMDGMPDGSDCSPFQWLRSDSTDRAYPENRRLCGCKAAPPAG